MSSSTGGFMNKRARAFSTTTIAAFALAIGLAGCSTLPSQEVSASGGAACLNLRSTVTNLEALRAWCLDHHDAAATAGWVTGIENSLKADAATSSQVGDVVSRLDEQVKLLSGTDSAAAFAQLPDVLDKVVEELEPARDAICA